VSFPLHRRSNTICEKNEADWFVLGTSATPSHQLPEEEMWTHEPVEAEEEAEVDAGAKVWADLESRWDVRGNAEYCEI